MRKPSFNGKNIIADVSFTPDNISVLLDEKAFNVNKSKIADLAQQISPWKYVTASIEIS